MPFERQARATGRPLPLAPSVLASPSATVAATQQPSRPSRHSLAPTPIGGPRAEGGAVVFRLLAAIFVRVRSFSATVFAVVLTFFYICTILYI